MAELTGDRHGSLERWAAAEQQSRGLVVTGSASQPHPRAWSTVVRIETSAGVVWAKQGATGARYEAGLLEILAEVCPDAIVTPLGLDVSSGRLLLEDGGSVLGEALETDGPLDKIATWEQVLRRYAALQRATEPLADRLIARGVPDQRPAGIVDVVAAMLGRDDLLRLDQVDGLASWERTRLVGLLPLLAHVAWRGRGGQHVDAASARRRRRESRIVSAQAARAARPPRIV